MAETVAEQPEGDASVSRSGLIKFRSTVEATNDGMRTSIAQVRSIRGPNKICEADRVTSRRSTDCAGEATSMHRSA